VFCEKAEIAGEKVITVIGPQVDATGNSVPPDPTQTVAFEARQLKTLFLKLHDSN
jgi:hypothetical protein